MTRPSRTRSLAALAAVAGIALAGYAVRGRTGEAEDPLAAEIERWSAFLRDHASTDEMWAQIKEAGGPALARASEALRDGRRLLALQRLSAARVNLAARACLDQRPADQLKEVAGLEAEWARLGKELGAEPGAPTPAALEGVEPAAVRALGEAALAQVRVYYEASLEYGRNTMPEAGFFYLGAAQAQRDLAGLCRTLSEPSSRRAPPLRDLGPELDALEGDLLALYKPPISIDRHKEFISASSALKEARELNATGLRYGALLGYLDAVMRWAALRPASRGGAPGAEAPGAPAAPAPGVAALEERLREAEARLSAGRLDHSLGRLYLEAAQADLARPAPDTGPATAAAIAEHALPRYFAALEPAGPGEPKPAPEVTVTLVRWPYT